MPVEMGLSRRLLNKGQQNPISNLPKDMGLFRGRLVVAPNDTT